MKLEIVESRLVPDTHFRLQRDRIALTDGQGARAEMLREVFDHGDGAGVLIRHRERDCFILARQFRYATVMNRSVPPQDGLLLEVPAGLLDKPGEDAETAIRREAEEEVGFRLGAVAPVACVWATPGSVTERLFLYYAEVDEGDRIGPGGGTDEHEAIELVEIACRDALAMVESGAISDAKTVILIQWWALRQGRAAMGAPGSPVDSPVDGPGG